jgi:hypothetical protein
MNIILFISQGYVKRIYVDINCRVAEIPRSSFAFLKLFKVSYDNIKSGSFLRYAQLWGTVMSVLYRHGSYKRIL